jgi:phage gp29-like protein
MAAPSLTGIRRVWRDPVADGLTPTRLAAILRAAAEGVADEYLTLAEEMEERDAHYGSVLGTRKLAVTGLAVRVDAASDAADDVRRADILRELTAAPEFGEMAAHLTDALGKGYAVVELCWDRAGALWTPRYAPRDPRFFTFDRNDGQTLRLRDEADPVNGIELPPYKFIVHTPKIRAGLPVRGGLARVAAVAYMCKAWTWRDWMAFADIYGLPMRIGKYGPNASEQDIEKLKAAIANLGSDAAGVMPDSMQVEFVQAAQTTGAADFFEKLAAFWDQQVSKAVLGQTMTADDGASLAQAKVHNEVRLDLLQADALALQNTLNRMLVRPFCDLNFGGENYPKLVIHVPQPEDTRLLVDALAALVPLGLEVEQSVVRDKLGLPDPEPGAVLLRAPSFLPSSPAAENTPASMPDFQQKQFSAANRAVNHAGGPAAAPGRVDQLAALLAKPADAVVAGWIEQIMQMIGRAASLDEVRDGLLALYPELDTGQLGALMQQALTAAGVAGMADAQDNTYA